MFSVEVNGTRYLANSKCPSCSLERDRGGRMEEKKRARPFLKCNLCKYSILEKKTRDKIEKGIAKRDGLSWRG